MLVVKATNRTNRLQNARWPQGVLRAFTLIDLLVSMAIIAVLIALLLPSLAGIREATRRVICSSNIRQQGLGLAMYEEDWKGDLPPTNFDPKVLNSVLAAEPQKTNIVRQAGASEFDGLGILFASQYLNAPQVFYCPSHHGVHPLARYAAMWYEPQIQLVSNFQYRGWSRSASGQLERASLVTDGLASRADYSHNVGSNVLRADYSVSWLPDVGGSIMRLLPQDQNDSDAAAKVLNAWNLIEAPLGSARPVGP